MEQSSFGDSIAGGFTRRLASGHLLAGLAGACVVCMIAFAFRDYVTERLAVSSPGSVLDKRLSYTPEEAAAYFDRIGSPGRRIYAITQFTLDLIFPVLYTALFMGAIARWCRVSISHWLVWMPLGIFAADIAENTLLVYFSFHADATVLARIASACTTIKWTLVGVCALGFVAGRFAMSRVTAK